MNRKLLQENMSTHLITIKWNESMRTAYQLMQSNRVRHLPVLSDSGEMIGMVSDRDVQRSMVSQIERPTGQILSDEKIEFDEGSQVRDYMSWPAKSIEMRTDLRRVAETMILEKVSSLLVCDGNRTVGIITVEDLLRVLMQLLSDPQAPKRWTMERLLKTGFMELNESPV